MEDISIRAPTRGATFFRLPLNTWWIYFNPRSHEGSDSKVVSILDDIFYFNPRSHEGSDLPTIILNMCCKVFQSALPRGERRKLRLCHLCQLYFNPRSHEGSDRLKRYVIFARNISIRAPTRGATEEKQFLIEAVNYFNPRSHEGSDLNGVKEGSHDGISIRAPTRGATRLMTLITQSWEFQSALPRGERLFCTAQPLHC